ncbi:chemotaxis response regulator protein-glutamate methylesterase [Halovulum dunhuangense]|uniref:Protein-glutamate methylesterase/protein-glutamine glutaminase n=1 Tax=Halovulum dunhuangense TaxID=1505036 RepID=A0A849L051_9RHOB|nr:chemotaxis response regulator protein-glutamate methylesterase [Halovulum dunhuangense]NNU79190.1 chemotaxis response regulator protein-glutamate methylesterase [Halovulum dunhuangense]
MISPSGPVRVLVVDDSALMRRMIRAGLEAGADIEVIAEAANTAEARQMIRQHDPDVVTLDVEMPGMNGIEFLKKIMELRPTPVIMVSTLTAAGTEVSLAALQIGAIDAIPKPSGREEVARFGRALRESVLLARMAWPRGQGAATKSAPADSNPPLAALRSRRIARPELIAIGASTGGVAALSELLAMLPPTLPPVVVTQHMPPMFTERFAGRLDALLPHAVSQAVPGEVLAPGQIRIAPGDMHLTVARAGGRLVTRLDGSGPISGHRPSVDVLFNSVATAVGGRALGVILTGMGRDGAAGMRALHNTGAWCIGQSQESCVVYGMPRAARELQAVDEEADLPGIARRMSEILNTRSAIRTA